MHHCPLSGGEEVTKLYHLLSAITWVLWSSSKIPNYLLFLSDPSHLGHARFQEHSKIGRQKTVPQLAPQNLECWTHNPTLPPVGEVMSWGFSPTCSMLNWGELQQVNMCSKAQTFVFSDPQFALSYQHLDLGKINISPWVAPRKFYKFGICSSLQENARSWECSQGNTALNWGQGLWQLITKNFPIGFDVAGFVSRWSVRAS